MPWEVEECGADIWVKYSNNIGNEDTLLWLNLDNRLTIFSLPQRSKSRSMFDANEEMDIDWFSEFIKPSIVGLMNCGNTSDIIKSLLKTYCSLSFNFWLLDVFVSISILSQEDKSELSSSFVNDIMTSFIDWRA